MFSILLAYLLLAFSVADIPSRRALQIINKSGETVSVEWIHPTSGQAIPLAVPKNGEEISFGSFINHTFVIRTSDSTDDSPTANASATFRVTKEMSSTILVKEGLLLEIPSEQLNHEPLSVEGISKLCYDQAMTFKDSLPVRTVLNSLVECLTRETADHLVRMNQKLTQERTIRTDVSELVENYTCADLNYETSDPIEIRTWNYQGEERTVNVLHNRPSSQIHMIKGFISEEECAAIEQAAKKDLHRGTVADGKGGTRLSDHRKAWQAGIPQKWDDDDDPITMVSKRLFAYANNATGYNLRHAGQEELMSIQYFGQGLDDPTPDRYLPHCDGDCDGTLHKTGGRVATIVIYCDVPELGGGTNFQHSNVFVKPTKGAAAFFSYLNINTMKMDTGFTRHSGCPVYQGIKRIVVQWMRLGVDEENPWNSFDTNTKKIQDIMEDTDE